MIKKGGGGGGGGGAVGKFNALFFYFDSGSFLSEAEYSLDIIYPVIASYTKYISVVVSSL